MSAWDISHNAASAANVEAPPINIGGLTFAPPAKPQTWVMIGAVVLGALALLLALKKRG